MESLLALKAPFTPSPCHGVSQAIKRKAGKDAAGLYQGKCLSPLACFRTVPNTVTPLTFTLS